MRWKQIILCFSLLGVLSLFVAGKSLGQAADVSRALPEEGESSSRTEINTAQATKYATTDQTESRLKRLAGDFASDQWDLWTSPSHLRFSDATWLVPLSGITAGLFVTDAQYSRSLSHNPSIISRYNDISNAGIAAMVGGAGAMWLLSYKNHNEHWRETGFLAGEAALNSLAMTEAMKHSFGRQRPLQGNGDGNFLSGGRSFPSEHTAAAWAVASVVSHEYSGLLTKILAYGAATGVSVSSVHSLNHFQSDVLIGSLVGNLAAAQVYKKRHNVELGGSSWETVSDLTREARHVSSKKNMASPYVPIDSWVYPAMDRLIALGLIQSAIVDMRPWTRFECARLLAEAGDRFEFMDRLSSPAAKIYFSLVQEFHDEIELPGGNNTRARLESAYTRLTEISGQPLSQGYHYDFGQTIINDYGRPYEEGFNNVTGFSAWATDARFVAYASGEFQHAGGAPPMSPIARQVISETQYVPMPPATPTSPVDRFELLDTYVGMTFFNWQITYGKQTLWWGPGAGGPMVFSNNAAPINMFRVSRVSPFKLPGPLKLMGPFTMEFFLGQGSGQNFIFGESTGLLGSWSRSISPQAMLDGERFSFKPTPNVEFGFSATSWFAGQGVPFNLHTYLYSIFRFASHGNPGTPQDPGDARTGFDLTYRLPYLRNWLTFYCDGFADDQFSPVAYWDRSAWTAGLYVSHFPKIPKLDLRVEGVFTDLPIGGAVGHGFFYWNDRFVTGYTNQGDLLGSWIGRDGQGAQAWSNYWFTPKNRLQFNFRHEKVSHQFINGGGSLTDVGARADFWFHDGMAISSSVQYERWLYPAIQPGPSRNVTTSIEFQIQPQKIYRPSSHHATGMFTATDAN